MASIAVDNKVQNTPSTAPKTLDGAMPHLDVESARAALRSMPPRTDATTELTNRPTVQLKNATLQDALKIANDVKASMAGDGRGGKGWLANATTDNNHCGQIADEAAERIVALARQRGFGNISVGTAQSPDGNMILGNGMHAIAIMYVGGANKVVTVDSWSKPPKVETPPFKVTAEVGMGKYITVWPTNVPRKDGYSGSVAPANPQYRKKEDTSKSPDLG